MSDKNSISVLIVTIISNHIYKLFILQGEIYINWIDQTLRDELPCGKAALTLIRCNNTLMKLDFHVTAFEILKYCFSVNLLLSDLHLALNILEEDYLL